jgi:hypothetical protein
MSDNGHLDPNKAHDQLQAERERGRQLEADKAKLERALEEATRERDQLRERLAAQAVRLETYRAFFLEWAEQAFPREEVEREVAKALDRLARGEVGDSLRDLLAEWEGAQGPQP